MYDLQRPFVAEKATGFWVMISIYRRRDVTILSVAIEAVLLRLLFAGNGKQTLVMRILGKLRRGLLRGIEQKDQNGAATQNKRSVQQPYCRFFGHEISLFAGLVTRDQPGISGW